MFGYFGYIGSSAVCLDVILVFTCVLTNCLVGQGPFSFLFISMDFLSLPLPLNQPQPLLDISLPPPQQPQLLDYFCDDFVCYTLQLLDDENL